MPQENLLIVEDSDLKYAIAELMKAHVADWGTNERSWKVIIKNTDGVDDALDHETLFNYMKAGGLKVLGLTVDADDKAAARWQRIRNFCQKCGATAPDDCPNDGFIVDRIIGESGIEVKFGAWIMPNNIGRGMIEDFCYALIPDGNDALLEHAETVVSKAAEIGAPFIPQHRVKAELHTWLAWQSPPGQSLGRAIANKTFLPDHGAAKPFVSWFRRLYDI